MKAFIPKYYYKLHIHGISKTFITSYSKTVIWYEYEQYIPPKPWIMPYILWAIFSVFWHLPIPIAIFVGRYSKHLKHRNSPLWIFSCRCSRYFWMKLMLHWLHRKGLSPVRSRIYNHPLITLIIAHPVI